MIIAITKSDIRTADDILRELPNEPWMVLSSSDGRVLDSGPRYGESDLPKNGSKTPRTADRNHLSKRRDVRRLTTDSGRRIAHQILERLSDTAREEWEAAKREVIRTRAKPVAESKPFRQERVQRRLLATLRDHQNAAVVAVDRASELHVRRIASLRPEQLVITHQSMAVSVLRTLRERGQPWTSEAARMLLDSDQLPYLQPYVFPPRREPGRPRVVSIVSSAVDGDSRVQKTAASLARFGFESILLGRNPGDGSDVYYYKGALIQRLHVPVAIGEWEVDSPPRTPTAVLGYRSRLQVRAAQAYARARSRETSAQVSRLRTAEDPSLDRRIRRLQLQDEIRRGMVAVRRAIHRTNRRNFLRLDSAKAAGMTQAWHRPFTNSDSFAHFARLRDFELAYGPQLERMKPDVIHAHDSDMLSVAVNASVRLAEAGWTTRVVYDAHEYTPGIARGHIRQRPVLEAVERAYVPDCDAVVTVSEEIAQLIQDEHDLAQRPVVVANAPIAELSEDTDDVRSRLHLDRETPLLVYTGSVALQRGVDIVMRALPQLPDVHLAVLARDGRSWWELVELAEDLGISERVHRLDYVDADDVTAFIATADIGLIPFKRLRNSELALPTKFREYVHAGLPIVASNFGAVAQELASTGIGEVFEVDDPEDMARAVSQVLANKAVYRERISAELKELHSWANQEIRLREVYDELDLPRSATTTTMLRARPGRTAVLLGPTNFAGQANGWANALKSASISATSYQVLVPERVFHFEADISVTRTDWNDPEYQLAAFLSLVPDHSHILIDGARRLFNIDGLTFCNAESLTRSGAQVGLVFHGSELRRPDRHAEREPWSPFRDPANSALRAKYQAMAAKTHEALASFEGPAFVSTPDLLVDLPWARWLPVVVDTDEFRPDDRDLSQRLVPVVLHAPSRAALKGSQFIDPVLRQLHAEGVIQYRRVDVVPHESMPALIRSADIVLDQVLMNLIGVSAAETMASGRVSVAHIDDRLAEKFPHRPPVVDATPDTLETTLRELAADPDQRATLGGLGRVFAENVHDGRMSARVLTETLGLGS